jgi:hypothetical protein
MRQIRNAGMLERGIAFASMIATIVLVTMLAVTGCGTTGAVVQWVAALTPVETTSAATMPVVEGAGGRSCER